MRNILRVMRLCVECLLLLLLLTGCRPAGNRTPEVEMPPDWRVKTTKDTEINLRWWEQFNDPVLPTLIDEAIRNNYDLRIAIARIEQYRNQWDIVRSQFYPQADLEASAVKEMYSVAGIPLVVSQPRTLDLFDLFFVFSYEVDLWGRIRNASDAALADLLGQIQARRGVVLTLVRSVATSYFTLRLLDKQLIIAKETLKSRQDSEDLARIRFTEGLTSELPVRQASSETDDAMIELKRLEERIPQEENRLSILLGRFPCEIERGSSLDEFHLPFEVPAGLPADLLNQRPDILQAEQALAATQFRVAEAKAELFPKISLTGLYGYSSLELKNLFSRAAETWAYGVTANQNIFSGGRTTSQIKENYALQQQALYQYFQTILTATQEVNDALVAHVISRELFHIRKKQIDDLTAYLQLAQLQYENGQTDYLNILDAQRSLFAAQLNFAENEANTFLTLINVYAALGGGWIDAASNASLK